MRRHFTDAEVQKAAKKVKAPTLVGATPEQRVAYIREGIANSGNTYDAPARAEVTPSRVEDDSDREYMGDTYGRASVSKSDAAAIRKLLKRKK